MWILDQFARFNSYMTLIMLLALKPCIRNNPDILHLWEVKEIVCREIIVNGHPLFRNRR